MAFNINSYDYFRAFTTDDDKNTIWDTTVEETLSATESSHSQNFKDSQSRYLDSTMINDNLFPAVKNYENCHQTTVKDKVVSPQDGKENLKRKLKKSELKFDTFVCGCVQWTQHVKTIKGEDIDSINI